jgi:hypothetical protein
VTHSEGWGSDDVDGRNEKYGKVRGRSRGLKNLWVGRYATIWLTVVTLVAGEIIPKALAVSQACTAPPPRSRSLSLSLHPLHRLNAHPQSLLPFNPSVPSVVRCPEAAVPWRRSRLALLTGVSRCGGCIRPSHEAAATAPTLCWRGRDRCGCWVAKALIMFPFSRLGIAVSELRSFTTSTPSACRFSAASRPQQVAPAAVRGRGSLASFGRSRPLIGIPSRRQAERVSASVG